MPPSLHSQYSCSSFINLLLVHTLCFFNSIKYFVCIYAKVVKVLHVCWNELMFFLPLQRIRKVIVLLCGASMLSSTSNMALTGRFHTLDFTMNKACLKIIFFTRRKPHQNTRTLQKMSPYTIFLIRSRTKKPQYDRDSRTVNWDSPCVAVPLFIALHQNRT